MIPGAGAFEELNRKNVEMFSKTMQMFSPFTPFGPNGQASAPQASQAQSRPQTRDEKIKQLKANITKMQEELRGMIQ
jgi:polyhydroxyalkanoate synthesis regulator protein